MDLQAGSEFGYRLLFVVLLAGVFAVFLQVCVILPASEKVPTPSISSYQSLASKLGVVTGLGELLSYLAFAQVNWN